MISSITKGNKIKFSCSENLNFETENTDTDTNTNINTNKDYNNNNNHNNHNNSYIKDNNSNISITKVLNQDLEVKNRNKRMMGVLMGTLSKFKSEEVDKSEANLKRILLEQRLTQKLLQAKAQLNTKSNNNNNNNNNNNFDDTEGIALKNKNLNAQEFSLNVLNDLKILKSETEDSCSKFQRTQTLPVLFFKRAIHTDTDDDNSNRAL